MSGINPLMPILNPLDNHGATNISRRQSSAPHLTHDEANDLYFDRRDWHDSHEEAVAHVRKSGCPEDWTEPLATDYTGESKLKLPPNRDAGRGGFNRMMSQSQSSSNAQIGPSAAGNTSNSLPPGRTKLEPYIFLTQITSHGRVVWVISAERKIGNVTTTGTTARLNSRHSVEENTYEGALQKARDALAAFNAEHGRKR